jgi:ABC-type sugar transport system ATPase subunit
MRVELKRLQQDLGKTMVYVTHDQIEAMSMADRIAVYRQGRLQQCDVPDVVYNRPANRYVATVVGSPPMNFLPCALVENGGVRLRHEVFAVEAREEVDQLRQRVAEGARDPGKLLLGVRPEDVAVLPEAPPQGGVPATVLVTEPLGAEVVVDLRVGADLVKAVAPPTLRVTPGQPVWLRFNLARAHVFDAESERNLFTPSTGDTLAPV